MSTVAASGPIAPQGFRLATGERIAAGLIALACAAVLFTASQLSPSPTGHGTHTQLHLPPCPWPMTVGGPCPTCGMTTSFAYAAHGHLIRSAITQPFGCVLAILTAAAFWASLHVAATGSPAGRMYVRLLSPRVLWFLAGLALAAWAYKWATWP